MIIAVIISSFPQRLGHETAEPKTKHSAAGKGSNWQRTGLILGISSLRTWVYYGFLVFATVYLTTYANVEYLFATLFVTGMFYAGMIATLATGISSDLFGRKEILLIAYACSIPCYLWIFLLLAQFSLMSLLAPPDFSSWLR